MVEFIEAEQRAGAVVSPMIPDEEVYVVRQVGSNEADECAVIRMRDDIVDDVAAKIEIERVKGRPGCRLGRSASWWHSSPGGVVALLAIAVVTASVKLLDSPRRKHPRFAAAASLVGNSLEEWRCQIAYASDAVLESLASMVFVPLDELVVSATVLAHPSWIVAFAVLGRALDTIVVGHDQLW